MALISDNVDTLVGFRLAGVRGVVVHREEELRIALNEFTRDKDLGILLVTVKLFQDFAHLLKPLRIKRGFPILVEIPDRHGMGERQDILLGTIRESMGVKV